MCPAWTLKPPATARTGAWCGHPRSCSPGERSIPRRARRCHPPPPLTSAGHATAPTQPAHNPGCSCSGGRTQSCCCTPLEWNATSTDHKLSVKACGKRPGRARARSAQQSRPPGRTPYTPPHQAAALAAPLGAAAHWEVNSQTSNLPRPEGGRPACAAAVASLRPPLSLPGLSRPHSPHHSYRPKICVSN
jgi:hypothetical protein